MDVTPLRHYGKGFSDAEGSWSPEMKAEMNRKGKAVVFSHLGFLERFRFGLAFVAGRRKARHLDLSDLRARGMTNDVFLATQLEYLALFHALVRRKGTDRAVAIAKEIMDATARKPMLACLPEPEKVRELGDTLEVFRRYFRAAPAAAERAGCNTIVIAEDSEDAFQFDVTWCVWLDLAARMGVPEACQPNCYADDLVFPDYFEELGIRYGRTKTLACGGDCCDFRFERID